MKKYLNILLAGLLIAFISTATFAQDAKSESKTSSGKVVKKETRSIKDQEQKKKTDKDKAKKERQEERKKKEGKLSDSKDKADSYTDLNDATEEVSKGKPIETKKRELEEKADKGNAYGKNKGDLEGKDFGQDRANQAKLNNDKKKGELNESLTSATNKISDANSRIKRARAKLDQAKKEGKMTDKEYKEKMLKIEKAEKAVKSLEEKVSRSKSLAN